VFATALPHIRLGNASDALAFLEELERSNPHSGVRIISAAYRLAIQRDGHALAPKLVEMAESGFGDPEGYYLLAAFIARDGDPDAAIAIIDRSVSGGFYCPTDLRTDPYLDPLRDRPAFTRLLAQAEAGHARAREAFARVGGAGILQPAV
jgi:hypothetical protein